MNSQMIRREVGTHTRAEHGGPYSVRSANPDGLIDFSSNIGPLKAPRKVIAALERSVNTAFAYPDPDSKQLCSAIAQHHKTSVRNIIAGNGATEIIYEYCRAFIRPKMHILVQAPTFAEYASAASLCGANIIKQKTMDISNNSTEFIKKIPHRGCVFVCNPNNPTGALVTRKLILEIAAEALKKESQLFVDECFIEFCSSNESVIRDVRLHENLFVLRSFTKSFGIPGVRIGYGVASAQIVAPMREAKVPWSVSGLAQSAGIAALGCQGHVAKAASAALKEVNYLYTAINAIDGMSAMPSMTNFVLARSSRYTGQKIRSKLLKKNILVRDCSSFDGLDSSFIRIGARTHKENMTLVGALESL